jgi:hypothetical protein
MLPPDKSRSVREAGRAQLGNFPDHVEQNPGSPLQRLRADRQWRHELKAVGAVADDVQTALQGPADDSPGDGQI